MSLPECYEYIAFEDVICDERRAYKKSKGRGQGVRYSKITNPRKENDYLYSFFAFKGLQKYHDYGYVELGAYHPGVRIGDKYILIRDPDTNRIINTYPASKYTLVLNDENLHVMLPEDLTFWEGYKLGITLDDTNSWPFDATVIDMFLDPFINKK